MMYEPLATRLRPRTFADVVGQEVTVRILGNAIRLGRIVPAYILSGPAGIGKTTLARLLAAGLNCTAPERPCGACDSCLDTQDGRSSFVLEVDGASDRGVAMVEMLQEVVALKLPASAYRTIIIDECHALSGKAWGAFLKTIEDPPPRNVFVFVTTMVDEIPETVRSRAMSLPLSHVSAEAIARCLNERVADLVVEPGVVDLIAQEAHGSLRDAWHLLDKVLLTGPPVRMAEVERLVGFESSVICDVADALLSRDFRYWVETVDRGLARAYGPADIASAVLRLARDFRVVRAGYEGVMLSRLPREVIRENTVSWNDGDLDRLYAQAVCLVESRRLDRVSVEAMYAIFLTEQKC